MYMIHKHTYSSLDVTNYGATNDAEMHPNIVENIA